MKTIIRYLLSISLFTVVVSVHSSETANNVLQPQDTGISLLENATTLIRSAVPSSLKTLPGLTQQWYSVISGYAKENPGKTIAAAAAALIVARAAYVIGFNYLHFNYLNSDAIILLSNPPQVIFGDKKRFIPRSWIEKWRLNKTSDYWHSSEIVEIRNKKTL